MKLLQFNKIPAGAIMNEKEIVDNEHLISRNYFIKLDHPIAGIHSYPKNIWEFLSIKNPLFKRANLYGEHNEEILRELLGITRTGIKRMWKEKIIGDSLDN
jgi:crotonobetainyl-CoA:carnitine CoA-transferase CaiB-like acyl-CoA transferase